MRKKKLAALYDNQREFYEGLMSMINKMSAQIDLLEKEVAIVKDPTRRFISKEVYATDQMEMKRRIDETESKATHGFYTHTALLEKLQYHFAGPIEELQRTQKKIMEMIKNE